ncbi:membrane-bound lytic murein transglycosylase D precursor [bacterium BMS3Abin03]|nr:membrane-bound lytic murein transglycosylase D precursor [bacterium BMS3Abin03]
MRDSKSKIYFFFMGVIATIGITIISASIFFSEDNPANVITNPGEQFPQGYRIVSPEIPDYIEFAGERVPLENFDVKERIDREFIVNTYFHSATILAFKRANRWFPVIEPILKKNNIPDDFKYLCIAESNLENVVSPAGATGFWQFMKDAGKKYGLEINSQIDERYNVEKSTEAACKYLKDAYKKFGSWMTAAGSFNMGVNGMEKQIGRQKANHYYNLVLNSETARYVSRIIALKEIFKDPAKYGFDIKEDDLYPPFKYNEVVLDSSVSDFADYAAYYGINYKTLKLYNPWLRDNYLSNRNREAYKIKFPEKGSIELIN